MKKIYDFNVEIIPKLSEVGGKAQSLIKLTRGGFNVPSGVVLTVEFFKEWISELYCLEHIQKKWNNPKYYEELSVELKKAAEKLEFSEEQKLLVSSILSKYKYKYGFAVRSSSPEEDLSGASFAGGYETILGVTESNIFNAIKSAFISCMDERVFFYKQQNGFDTSVLRIAVIIQEQIKSEISGVGFSLNPLSNNYNEVVINSNTGLGESVVSGMITPDEFVINKYSNKIIESKIGSKKQAVILQEQGGTRVVEGIYEQSTLNDKQLFEITKLIISTESFYGYPIDIEWAYSNDKLYILQARPITTYIPLPAEMKTKPSEQPILYLDGSLVKQGITTPISVLGCDCIAVTQSVMFKDMMGKDTTKDVKGGIATTRGGRMYINVSSTIKLQGLKRMVATWNTIDVATAKMLETLDLSEYIPKKKPKALNGVMWGTIKNSVSTIKYVLKAMKNPIDYKSWYQPFEDDFDAFLNSIDHNDIHFERAPHIIFEHFISLLNKMMPMTFAAEIARKKIANQLNQFYNDGNKKMQLLERSLPNNVTIDMGMKMYELSQMNEIKNTSYKTFCIMLDSGSVSKEFNLKWQSYLNIYGCRTRNELDVGERRSSEKIEELYEQIKRMSTIDESFSPIGVYKDSQLLREKTYEEVTSILKGSELKKFKKRYNILVELGGKRESLKYWYVRSLAAIRSILLSRAKELVNQNKLDIEQDIFWLHLNQVNQAPKISKQEIKRWINENKQYFNTLNQVNYFPKLIDSRGKILTMPKAEPKKGELVGQPISPGLVKGRAKVLNSPDEKPLLPGEIMVTRATDPGWTPLFINAAAIILEVGGLLQHGALVAREYGKPCIAGIEGVTQTLKDGQLLEIDATAGIVRIIEESNE